MEKTVMSELITELYPEVIILYIEELERQMLDKGYMWIPDTPSYFVQVMYTTISYNDYNMSNLVSDFTGCEVNIFK
jgi:hypothetical protein